MTEFANQVAINELEATIKKQNQILLHIKAELEAAKQYNPFNLVLISGSIENISNIVDDHFASVPTIDEWDGGCARSCKVVDIAAKLQEELDECNERCTKLGSHNMQITANLLDRKKLIDGLRETIENFKTIETKETDRLHKIIGELNDENLSLRVTINDMAKKHIWYKNTIKELKDRNSEDLNKLYALDKEELDKLKDVISARESSIDDCEKIGRHNVNVLKEIINGLEAELSARKKDSEVLKKVVEIVNWWEGATSDLSSYTKQANTTALRQIATAVEDYICAPEGPPETPIDEKVCVFCGCKNPSIQVGRDWFCSMRCADGQADVNKHIHDTDEPQDIKVTFAYLELP